MIEKRYQPRRYWSDRLDREFSLRGTGYLSYSLAYNRWLYRAKRRALRRSLANAASGPALDIGSGVGWVVAELLGQGREVEGCDVAPGAVERLRLRFPDVPFLVVELGAERVPRPDGSYALLTALDVLYHLADEDAWRAALEELARLTRPGGAVVVTDGFGEADRAPAPHVQLRSRRHWEGALGECGLRLERALPLYRWLSRDPGSRPFNRLPGGIRGAVEYSLERFVPRQPHMQMATLVRDG